MASTTCELTLDCTSLGEQCDEVAALTNSLERLLERVRGILQGLGASDVCCGPATPALGAGQLSIPVSSGLLEQLRSTLRALNLDLAHSALDSIRGEQ
jgi:hypothetical protein